MNKKEFIQELRKFLDGQGMQGIDILTQWKLDYIPMVFTSLEGVEYFLKIKERKKEKRNESKRFD